MPHTSKIINFEWKTSSVFELAIDRNGMEFTPGDSISIFDQDETQSRPYSLASGTGESIFRVLVQRLPKGEVSNWLSTLKPGDSITYTMPFGWFRPGQNLNGDPFVFIATGTGIAPFLSYLRAYPESPPTLCLYGIKNVSDALEFDFLSSQCEVKLAVSRENGHKFHHGRVTHFLPNLDLNGDTHFYLCGLDAMIDDVSEWLENNGVDFTRIHREVFFYDGMEKQ